MTSTMGNAPQATTYTPMVPTTNSQIHKAGINQQVKQQLQAQQQALLQQANVFLSVDPRLMDKNIVQFMTVKPTNGSNGSYVVEESEDLAERGVSQDDEEWIENPYAEPMDFYSLKNMQPRHSKRSDTKQPTSYSVFNPPSGTFGLFA
jgi:hypothetical protein